MTRRVVVAFFLVVAALAAIGYLAAGMSIYDRLTLTEADCAGRWPDHTPADFAAGEIDVAPLEMASYETVRIPSRDPAVSLHGWYVPAPEAAPAAGAAPAVLVIHGHNACTREPQILLAAGMLHRNGFAVLMVDLRNHGRSTVTNGRFAGGTNEYRDVLGAWDWLRAERSLDADRIGIVGFSLGAGSVLIAAGEEPGVAAAWEDSGWADVPTAIRAELSRNGYPDWFEPSAQLVGWLVSGDDLTTLGPARAVKKMAGRPLAIVHGSDDTRLSVQYADDLAAAYRAGGGTVEPWILAGVGHTRAILEEPAEYERRLVAFFSRALSR